MVGSVHLPRDLWERIFLHLEKQEWAACCLACRQFYETISSSRHFFTNSLLVSLPGCDIQQFSGAGLAAPLPAGALKRLACVGPTLRSARLTGAACTRLAAHLPCLDSLSLEIQDTDNTLLVGQLGQLWPRLRKLCLCSYGGAGPLGILRTLGSSAAALISVSISIPCHGQQGAAASSFVERLAEGLPGLAAVTCLSLCLPLYAEQLNEAIGCLCQLASLSVTTNQKPESCQGCSAGKDAPTHVNAVAAIRPECWVSLRLTQLMLNLAGDCTPVEAGLSRLEGLRRLSIVGAGRRSPVDLFAGAGAFLVEALAVAGMGGLSPVPEHLDTSMPRLLALEASYGALADSLYPPQLCLRQLTSVDLYNAGLESTEDTPHQALPAAFSKMTALRSLNLSKNFLQVLPPAVCALTALARLSVWGNHLSDLPRGPYLASLSYLNISANQFSCVPVALAAATRLQHLGLGSNPILSLGGPEARVLQQLTGLRRLGLAAAPNTLESDGSTSPSTLCSSSQTTGLSDLQVAVLWGMAFTAPACLVSFHPEGFEGRFC